MDLPQESAYQHINSINFSLIIEKLMKSQKWSKDEAQFACNQYKNFLFLLKKYQEKKEFLVPTKDIDEVWHNHILDTVNYEKDCKKIFGRFIHHDPASENDKEKHTILKQAFKVTQDLYIKEFGVPIYEVKARRYYILLFLELLKKSKLLFSRISLS